MDDSVSVVVLAAGDPGDLGDLGPICGNVPECLLPVANQAMMLRTFDHLAGSGFHSAVVVVTQTQLPHITVLINDKYHGPLKLDLVPISDDAGTAQALLAVKQRVNGEILVVAVDLALELPPEDRTRPLLQALRDEHRLHGAAATVLLKDHGPPRDGKAKKWEHAVVLSKSQDRLLYMASAADSEGKLCLRTSLLARNANARLYTTLSDVHCYVFAPWVLDLIEAQPQLASVRYELLPYLLRQQYINSATDLPEAAYNNRLGGRTEKKVLCNCVIVPPDGLLCMRTGTLSSYLDLNLWYASHRPSGEVGAKTGFGAECIRGEGVQIGAGTAVKKSVVGEHCNFGANVKVINCVVMDHVTLHDNVNLTNCIVCSNAEIENGAVLKDCQVGLGFRVSCDSHEKNQLLGKDQPIK